MMETTSMVRKTYHCLITELQLCIFGLALPSSWTCIQHRSSTHCSINQLSRACGKRNCVYIVGIRTFNVFCLYTQHKLHISSTCRPEKERRKSPVKSWIGITELAPFDSWSTYKKHIVFEIKNMPEFKMEKDKHSKWSRIIM